MVKQLTISYSSAYLKYQLLKGAWYVHKQSILSQIPMVHDFINNKLIVEDNQEELKMTLPYSIQIKAETAFEQGKNIAVVPIIGSLMKKDYCGAAGMQTIAARIKQAEQTESVSGIILNIDSPGGTVDGTKELADTVKACTKPIIAFADGLAASAAYWIGSSANKFIAKDTTTEVGSIGVVLSFIDNQKAMEKEGYEFHDIFADQSSEKWKEMIDAQKGDYSTIKEWTLNPLASEFQEAVKGNRPNVKDKALHGRVYLAKLAKRLGLIDSIGNFDFAVQELSKLISNKNINIMEEITKKDVEQNLITDKGFMDKLKEMIKPEVKDISEETKTNFETQLAEKDEKIAELENTITELNTNIEDYGIEKGKIEDELTTSKDQNDLILLEVEKYKTEIAEFKTKVTENVAKTTLVESDEDKLEIGKISAEEQAWLNEAKKMKAVM